MRYPRCKSSNDERGNVAVGVGSCGGLVDSTRHNTDHILRDLDSAEEALDDGPRLCIQALAGVAGGTDGVLELGHVGGDGPLHHNVVSCWKSRRGRLCQKIRNTYGDQTGDGLGPGHRKGGVSLQITVGLAELDRELRLGGVLAEGSEVVGQPGFVHICQKIAELLDRLGSPDGFELGLDKGVHGLVLAGATQPPETVDFVEAVWALHVQAQGEAASLPERPAVGVAFAAMLRVNEVQDLLAAGPEEASELLQSQQVKATLAAADVHVEPAAVVEDGEWPGADEADDLGALVEVGGLAVREDTRDDLDSGVLLLIDRHLVVHLNGDVVGHDPRQALTLLLGELGALYPLDLHREDRAQILLEQLVTDGKARVSDDLTLVLVPGEVRVRKQLIEVGYELDLKAKGHGIENLGQGRGSQSHDRMLW